MNRVEYNRKLFACRTATEKVQAIASRRITSVLQDAYDELVALMGLASEGGATYNAYLAKKNAIGDLLHQASLDINVATRLGIRKTADSVTGIYSDLAETYASSAGFSSGMGGAFDTVPLAAARNVTGRVWGDGRNVSSRVWRMDRHSQNAVNQILSKGIARGQGAADMSRELRRFLVNPELTPGTTWTTNITRSVSGRGTIHYNALRLARTEINNTYRETMVQANHRNPIMRGVLWHMSAEHPTPDICDVWAGSDLYGMGSGVHPALATPIDHPNGKCYFTDVIRDASQWGQPKQQFASLELPRSTVLRPLAATGASDGVLNQAWKMYESTKALVRQEIRRAA